MNAGVIDPKKPFEASIYSSGEPTMSRILWVVTVTVLLGALPTAAIAQPKERITLSFGPEDPTIKPTARPSKYGLASLAMSST